MMVRLVGSRFFRVLASSTLFALPPSRRSLHTRPTERLTAMSSSSALLFVVICLNFPPAQLCAGGDRHDALYPVSRWRRPCGRGRGRRRRAPVGTERTLIRRERTSERACEGGTGRISCEAWRRRRRPSKARFWLEIIDAKNKNG